MKITEIEKYYKEEEYFNFKKMGFEKYEGPTEKYEGPTPKELGSAVKALKKFDFDCPNIPDYKLECTLQLDGYLGFYSSWTDENEETHWQKECPDHEHECAREGCGRTVSESYSFGGSVIVMGDDGIFYVVADFVQNVSGGYGF